MATAILAASAILGTHCASSAEITDQRGRRFVFDTAAKRLVFLPMPAPATYVAIDGTERNIAGMNPASASAMRQGILGKLFPGFSRIATDITLGAGTNPNIETILALRPDAVFQWSTAGDDALAMLDRTGLRVLGMRYGTQEDMNGTIALMGQVAGKEARAAELVRRNEVLHAKITSAVQDVAAAQRPRVLHLSRASDSLGVAGRSSYSDFYIRLAGGENVAADVPNGRVVTIEQILTWNPQVILLGNFDTVMPADLYKDPRWQSVDAVRQRRVYRVPLGGYRWDPPSQESALMWWWLAGLLQPERTAQTLRADMRDWYQFLYGHALSDEEIDGILFVAENGPSAGYGRYVTR